MMKVLLFVSLLSGCTDLGPVGTHGADLSIEDAVPEAVFTYQFQNNESGQQQSAKVYFFVGQDVR
jgi:hypothetical protein